MEPTLSIYTPGRKPDETTKNEIIDFLYEHLEQFGDPREQVALAVGYSLQEYESFGGLILLAKMDGKTVGAVVINRTGMKDYIPENILVYIAVHREYRGKKIGRYLMMQAIENAEGNIALHVEPDNPARFLYKKVGFTSKYLEMRYQRGAQ